ncbi:ParB/RepB/Spo0J family partition protein [Ruminococcus sp. AM43-6]|jgi:ParB family chromosome partitioning protein|uniref:ParB/RepB/Spo0J family partition protein n=1 Tax=Ruminococcus sp. AM43-6 TaxID=2293216 RepID=UPI001FA8CED5|nr:ParB/RepB/Spo0J family partition protein [Ruminococcus sp. AM43-6]UYJ32576.1 MAG: ParB/RepB/Spo0J family partition protein [Oscillospiraceae bacterium]
MNVKLEKLHPFENHPYKVLDDSSMTELVESIKEYGLLNRIIVRPIDDKPDEYEIISGHRRVHAAELLEMKEVPAVVHFIDRDQATILMVDSNCQRENLSLMEKAWSYRMKLDAIKHQGKALGQNVPKLDDNRTTAKIGAESGDNYKTVQRLIRLTHLVPELQEFVDSGKMKMLPAYELSFLNEEAQRDIVDRIDETESFPSHAQARRMRAAFEEGTLDYDTVAGIMAEVKPNQVEKLKIPMDDIRKYVPSSMTPAEMLEYLLKLVKNEYNRHHNRDAR